MQNSVAELFESWNLHCQRNRAASENEDGLSGGAARARRLKAILPAYVPPPVFAVSKCGRQLRRLPGRLTRRGAASPPGRSPRWSKSRALPAAARG